MFQFGTIIAAVLLTVPISIASAQFESDLEEDKDTVEVGDPNRPTLYSKVGMGIAGGAGVSGFTDSSMNDVADVAGAWEARLVVGTRTYLAGEVAYVGSAQDVTITGLDSSAYLLSNGLQGAVRANFIPEGMWQPYVVVGAAWRRYNVENKDVNTSSMRNEDDVLEVPFGAGLSFRTDGLLLDARLMARPAVDADLLGDQAELHTLDGKLTAGWEF